jgi:glycosyltransferase involved in cell wall biosynthesis
LPRYYRLAATTVLPSTTMGEAFGLVLVESLASGTPVVATDLPGVRTVVEHGSDGLLVAPGNPAALAGAIGRLTRYATMREVMGMRGRAKVEGRYHWALIGRRLETLYAQVLDEGATLPAFHLRRSPQFASTTMDGASHEIK